MGKYKLYSRHQGYSVKSELYGFNAYAVKKLIGIQGSDKAGVLEFILSDWMGQNAAKLEALGINLDAARQAGYFPLVPQIKNKSKKKKIKT